MVLQQHELPVNSVQVSNLLSSVWVVNMHSRWFCYSQRTWRRVIIDISLWNFNFLNFLGCHTDEFCFMLLVYLHTCKVTSRNLWYPLLVTPHVLQCIILKFACSLVNESRPMPPTGYMRCNWSCSLRGRVQSQQLLKKSSKARGLQMYSYN